MPDPARVQSVFLMVLDHPSPGDRAAVLDRECGADVELRRRVEALLLAHDQPGGLLDRPFLISDDRGRPAPDRLRPRLPGAGNVEANPSGEAS